MRFALLVAVLLSCSSAWAVVVEPQAPSAVGVGETVAVDLLIRDVQNLYGYQFEVRYDPSMLSFVRLQPGTFLSQGRTTFSIQPDFRQTGTVKNIAELLTGDQQPVSGSGTAHTIVFQAKTPGTTQVEITLAKLADSTAQSIGNAIGAPAEIQIGISSNTESTPSSRESTPPNLPPQPLQQSEPVEPTHAEQQVALAQQQSPEPLPAPESARRESPMEKSSTVPIPPQGTEVTTVQVTDSTTSYFLAIATVIAILIGGYAYVKARRGDKARVIGQTLLPPQAPISPAAAYIQQMRARGYRDAEIAQQLRAAGWNDTQFTQHLK